MIKKYNRGFTLLELLVVIAIIGMLTAVVLASISNSRNKARDSAIVSEMKQFQILLNLEYNETGSYAKLQTSSFTFITTSSACDSAFPAPPTGSNYYDKARDICKKIVENGPKNTGGSVGFVANNRISISNRYSMMAVLNLGPYDSTYYCLGSGGSSLDPGYLNGVGCWSNP